MQFTYHKDHQTGKWHCFEVVDGHEIYMCTVDTVEEAIQWIQYQTYGSPASEFTSMARGA